MTMGRMTIVKVKLLAISQKCSKKRKRLRFSKEISSF